LLFRLFRLLEVIAKVCSLDFFLVQPTALDERIDYVVLAVPAAFLPFFFAENAGHLRLVVIRENARLLRVYRRDIFIVAKLVTTRSTSTLLSDLFEAFVYRLPLDKRFLATCRANNLKKTTHNNTSTGARDCNSLHKNE